MRTGFSKREVYNIYRSLAKELYPAYNYDFPLPKWTTCALDGLSAYNSIAETEFGDPDNFGNLLPYAYIVRMNELWLPHMYEDEIVGCIIHEIAHVVAGFHAGHTDKWSSLAAAMGGHHQQTLLIRNWENLPPRLSTGARMLVETGRQPDYA